MHGIYQVCVLSPLPSSSPTHPPAAQCDDEAPGMHDTDQSHIDLSAHSSVIQAYFLNLASKHLGGLPACMRLYNKHYCRLLPGSEETESLTTHHDGATAYLHLSELGPGKHQFGQMAPRCPKKKGWDPDFKTSRLQEEMASWGGGAPGGPSGVCIQLVHPSFFFFKAEPFPPVMLF